MTSETDAHALVVRFDGVFDLAAAQYALRILAEAPEGSEVYIDLMQVRQFHDHGVAILAEGLAKSSLNVVVRGLGTHQCRMLRYMGVKASALGVVPLSRASALASDVP